MKKLFLILFTLLTFVSCNKKPTPYIGCNITDLKNKGVCERTIGGHPSVWSLIDKNFKTVSFDEGKVALNENEIVEGVCYKKSIMSWPSYISQSDKERFQREFNILDRHFSSIYKEEGEYRTASIGDDTRTYISWERDGYKVTLCTNVSKKNIYNILLELKITTSSFNNPFIFFL